MWLLIFSFVGKHRLVRDSFLGGIVTGLCKNRGQKSLMKFSDKKKLEILTIEKS